ncbi:extracellular solute-binding protein [Actinocatenispora rupis]|uniref:Sugar ABC transporter substrate-binding protein n=1 Tax=Actinocatenispora rupis TaxID=519421 RepID=A0A8J3N829_9ACTN|nr:extracellular solute-binding protein [Actinocatenispora rupis]GID09681.1 sugar ABC transporter substrate-binding protein [Actinocatenispora rupis]
MDTTLSRRGLLRAGATAAVAAPLLAACSRTPAADTGGGDKTFTLYWNAGHGYDAYAKVVRKFEADHKITVNWQKFQWPDLQTKLTADIQAGTVPDLVEDDGSGWPVTYATSGDALALDDFIAADGEKVGFPHDWQDNALRNVQYRGKTYGVPLHLTCNLLFYNKKMFADAGLKAAPSTWDEFLSAARKLTHGQQHGVALNSDFGYSSPWILQNGVKYWDPSAKQVLTPADRAAEALGFQHDLIHRYKVSPVPVASSDYEGPEKLFVANRVAMMLSGPWDFAPIKQAAPKLDLGLALPLSHTARATSFAGSGVFIPAKAKHPDLAWDLITRLTALDVELAATAETGMTMPRKSWAANATVKADPLVGAVARALAYGQSWPNGIAATGKATEVSDAWKTAYESTILSNGSAAQAVTTFRSTAAKLVGG